MHYVIARHFLHLTDFINLSVEDPTDIYFDPVPWSVKLINSMMTKGQTKFIMFKWTTWMSNKEYPSLKGRYHYNITLCPRHIMVVCVYLLIKQLTILHYMANFTAPFTKHEILKLGRAISSDTIYFGKLN